MSQVLKPKKGYKLEKLKNLCIFSSGEFLPTKNQKKGNIPVFGGNGINGFHNKSLIKIPVIIIGRVGAYCGSIHLSEEQCWITDNAIFIEKLNEGIDVDYMFRFLSKININLLAEVSAQPKITQSILRNIIIDYPIKKEQQKIASILSGVDALIQNTSDVIEKSTRLKKSLMQKLLTKGIGHDKFKKVTWLFGKEIEIPEEWEVKTISELGEIVTGSTPDTKNREFFDDDFLWASPIDFEGEKYLTQTNSMLSKKGLSISRKIPKDAVLVVCIGSTIGKIGMASVEMSTNQQINSIICNNVDSNFIYYQLQQNNYLIKNRSNQSAVPIINKTEFGKFKLIKPCNIVEQQKIASILSGVDASIVSQTQYKEKLERLKKSLMQKLLTGQVRVTV